MKPTPTQVHELTATIAEALEQANPNNLVYGEDERGLIADSINKFFDTKRQVRIEGRRHFDGQNTYHSVEIFLDGESVAIVGRSYGYGQQYVETGLNWLRLNGYLGEVEKSSNGMWKYREKFEELGWPTWESPVIDVDNRDDLHQEE